MTPSYKEILRAHILFSLSNLRTVPLKVYVQQLMAEHPLDRQEILSAYHDVKIEMRTSTIG